MKLIFLVFLALFSVGCKEGKLSDGRSILTKTILEHDPSNSWDNTKLNIHIQEPRISNPKRYSILELDNINDSFALSRNRGQHISEHKIDSDGISTILVDGEKEIDTMIITKYRLDASKNIGYKFFYKLLYGLPMSLNNSLSKIINTSESIFDDEECFKIQMELKESIISKYWILYVSKLNMRVKGIEIIFPDNPHEGERIYFDEIIIINGIKIPRIRNWHGLKDNTYSGTDLIIKEIEH